jgi:hypothetical protein
MEVRKPSLTDYMAGGMLTNGVVWVWSMFLTYVLKVQTSQTSMVVLLISYLVYLGGSVLAAYLVCQRTTSNHIIVALKTSAAGWIFTLFFMLSYVQVSLGTVIVLLVTFGVGGFIGSYLALKKRLGDLRSKFGASPSEP